MPEISHSDRTGFAGQDPDIHHDVEAQAHASVEAPCRLIETGIRPRDIVVKEAFENAVATACAMGGSTNL